jgi:hypothetical protein
LVKIELPADTRLRSGLFGRAQFSRGNRPALLSGRHDLYDFSFLLRSFQCVHDDWYWLAHADGGLCGFATEPAAFPRVT